MVATQVLANSDLHLEEFNIGLVYGINKDDNDIEKLQFIKQDFDRLGDIFVSSGIKVIKNQEDMGLGVIIASSEPRLVVSPVKCDDDYYARRF